MTKARSNAVAEAAKGDLSVGSGTNLAGILAVGNNGETLVADSSTSTGLKYSANAPLGAMSAISTNNALTGASTVTVSGFSNKSRLWVNLDNVSTVNTGVFVGIRFNTDSGNVYGYNGTEVIGTNSVTPSYNTAANQFYVFKTSSNAADTAGAMLTVDGTFTSGLVMLRGTSQASGTNSVSYQFTNGFYVASAQITSISIISSSGNFDAGFVSVWGA
jgi:hypothetical protein